MAIKTYFKMILMPALLAMMLALEADATALERGSSQSLRAKAHHIMAAVKTPTDVEKQAAALASVQGNGGAAAAFKALKAKKTKKDALDFRDLVAKMVSCRTECGRKNPIQPWESDPYGYNAKEKRCTTKCDRGRFCERDSMGHELEGRFCKNTCIKKCWGRGPGSTPSIYDESLKEGEERCKKKCPPLDGVIDWIRQDRIG